MRKPSRLRQVAACLACLTFGTFAGIGIERYAHPPPPANSNSDLAAWAAAPSDSIPFIFKPPAAPLPCRRQAADEPDWRTLCRRFRYQ